MKELVALIRELLEGLAPRGRWVALASMLLVLFVFLLGIEHVTAWNHYRGLEKRVELLTQLHELEVGGIRNDEELGAVFDDVVESLGERRGGIGLRPTLEWRPTLQFWKALTGALLWIALGVPAPFGTYGQEHRAIATAFFTFFAVLFGYLGAALPTAPWPWANLVLFPIVQGFGLTMVVMWNQRRIAQKKAG